MRQNSPEGAGFQSAMALSEQVAASLATRVRDLPEGAQIPTETALMEEFSVSRTTIRAAVAQLVAQGRLVRRQGKGTFVLPQPTSIVHSLDHLSPFFAVLAAAGQKPATRVLDFGWVSGAEVPAVLAEDSERALSFRRLYLTEDGTPHAVLRAYVAQEYGTGISRHDVVDTPLFHLLERTHDLILRKAEYSIRSLTADQELADIFQLPVGAPLLLMTRLTHSPHGRPVEQTEHYLRADMYELTVHIDDTHADQASVPWALTHLAAATS